MSKMTIIQLLNKIANGEIPRKIKFDEYEYTWYDKEHGYCRPAYDCTYICMNTDYHLIDILNYEVEVIEDNKKIEKLHKELIYVREPNGFEHPDSELPSKEKMFNKINEIIDKLNEVINNGTMD